MSLRLLLVAIVFAADLWALLQVLHDPRVQGRRRRWILCIIGLPVIGIVLWVRRRRTLGPLPGG